MILPVADYCDVVYHSLLPDELDEELKRMQCHALRCIYGPKISGRKMRAMAGLTTLRERRVAHCDAFASKCVDSRRYNAWFPLRKETGTTKGTGTREKF